MKSKGSSVKLRPFFQKLQRVLLLVPSVEEKETTQLHQNLFRKGISWFLRSRGKQQRGSSSSWDVSLSQHFWGFWRRLRRSMGSGKRELSWFPASPRSCRGLSNTSTAKQVAVPSACHVMFQYSTVPSVYTFLTLLGCSWLNMIFTLRSLIFFFKEKMEAGEFLPI